MAEADQANEHLKRYLQQLTPKVRSRLLTELERLHLLGEDVPHSEKLLALLRAEFRNTGQSHYRAGNPSRNFFQPLEPLLINGAPERANCGQIARGSLGPIWSLITEKLLPSMARDYIATANKVIVASDQREAQNIATAFQKKVVTYLDGVLGSADGKIRVRTELEIYTSSHATFNDMMKMLLVIRAQQSLAEFTVALPPKILEFEGETLTRVLSPLNALRAKQINAVPFALTIVSSRLRKPWQLIRLATGDTGSRAAAKIQTSPYAIVVSMVLDQVDNKRLMLLDALKNNRTPLAKEILSEIYEAEDAVKACVDLRESDWGSRLRSLMTSIKAAVDSEVNTVAGDRLQLRHVLESAKSQPSHSWTDRLSQMIKKGQATLAGS